MRKTTDWLGEIGGWVLVVLGIALIALAAVFADKATVAPVFAFGGIVAVVLGVLLARVEGDFELTPTSLKAQLTAVATVARREDLTVEEKGDEIIGMVEALEARFLDMQRLLQAPSPPQLPPATEQSVARIPGGRAQLRGALFEQAVAEYFRRDGWEIVEQTPDYGIDFIATKPGERKRLIQAKALHRLSTADVERLIAMTSIDQMPADARYVLATPAGSLTISARQRIAEAGPDIELLELPETTLVRGADSIAVR